MAKVQGLAFGMSLGLGLGLGLGLWLRLRLGLEALIDGQDWAWGLKLDGWAGPVTPIRAVSEPWAGPGERSLDPDCDRLTWRGYSDVEL